MSLQELRNIAETRDIPIISSATEVFLSDFLEKNQPKVVLEIGTAIGYSTIFFAQKIAQRGGHIYAFEVSYAAYAEALQHIKNNHIKNITLYPFNFTTVQLQKLVPTSCDLIFIDGQKNQYANYMMKIQENINESAVVVLDDVIKYANKLSSLYEYLQKKQIFYKVFQLDEDDGVMVIGKLDSWKARWLVKESF